MKFKIVSDSASNVLAFAGTDFSSVPLKIITAQAEYVDRNTLVAVQSPEAHRLSLLCELFQRAQRQKHILTESCCTMLLYHMGYDIHFIESNVNNIKLIREADIAVFQALV